MLKQVSLVNNEIGDILELLSVVKKLKDYKDRYITEDSKTSYFYFGENITHIEGVLKHRLGVIVSDEVLKNANIRS